MNIFLVRHGLSEGNVNKKIHHELPDHAIPLAEEGHIQAKASAKFLEAVINNDREKYKKIRLWCSPYRRTKETAKPFNEMLDLEGKPLLLDTKEDVALCEQQFGLFDGLEDDELKDKFPNEWAHYDKCQRFEGRFWARMPLGESRFDVTLRVHQIFGTWLRDKEKHGIDTIIVVSHGVTIRAIIMRWMHYSVRWFEEAKNPKNCSIQLIKSTPDNKYVDRGYVYYG